MICQQTSNGSLSSPFWIWGERGGSSSHKWECSQPHFISRVFFPGAAHSIITKEPPLWAEWKLKQSSQMGENCPIVPLSTRSKHFWIGFWSIWLIYFCKYGMPRSRKVRVCENHTYVSECVSFYIKTRCNILWIGLDWSTVLLLGDCHEIMFLQKCNNLLLF